MSSQMKMDLTGMRFNRLTVLGKAEIVGTKGNQNQKWHCRCDCGNTSKVRTSMLKNGQVKSCGCIRGVANRGMNNYRVKQAMDRYGDWMPSANYWYRRAKQIIYRAKKEGTTIGFDSPYEFARYLDNAKVEVCPVFGVRLAKETTTGRAHDWTPSVDRILPELGYVQGNIQIISNLANAMKQNATPEQLRQFARWVLEEHNA